MDEPRGDASRREGSEPPFEASGFFALRTPLLPLASFLDWGEGLEAPRAAAADLAPALARDREKLRARLRAWLERPVVREAVFLASPSLDDSLEAWRQDPSSERGEKVEASLAKYFARLCGRATPFGLFAGCSVGSLGERTRLELEPAATARRHTRLDDDYLTELADRLSRDPLVQAGLVFRPSTSLYRAAGRIRFAAGKSGPEGRSYRLAAVDPAPHLEAALEAARGGASLAAIGHAVRAVVGDAASDEEVAAFLGELVSAQILRSDLEPLVTGEEPIHDLLRQLAPVEAASPVAASVTATLARVRDDLAAIDANGGAPPTRYRDLARALEALPAPVALPRLFQVDLVKPAPRAVLGAEVVRELARAAELLASLAPRAPHPDLEAFRDAFARRWEQRTVPLVEALDEESGIGFGRSSAPSADASPLLAGIEFPARGDAFERWEARHTWLEARLERHAARTPLDLGEKDLTELRELRGGPDGGGGARLPDAFAVHGTLAASSEGDLDAGRFAFLVESLGGPSGANLLGRFCHGDPELEARVRAHLRAEEALAPGVAFAEIVHLPEGRLGNVILRPVLRELEIPFLGRSGAPDERQVPLEDLLVSVEGERVVLRSRRLGREIAPRLTSALNVEHRSSQGVHRFLAALQHQGVAPGVGWSWGPLEARAYLPRVTAGRLVLALARWRIDVARWREELEKKRTPRFSELTALRAKLGLPRLVALRDGDNVLPVDLENALSAESFLGLVKDRPAAIVQEVFPGPAELVARGPEGAYVHEVVVPFVRRARVPAGDAAAPASRATGPRASALASPTDGRVFLPGSEWLTAKLYSGNGSVDGLLAEVARPIVDEARESGAATGWFFVRFGDPDWHLRLRLRGDPARLLGEVLPRLHERAAAALADGRLHRLELATYEREVERYGGPGGVALAERVFEVDSDAVLAIVERLSGDAGADARWRLALRGIDALLADLGLDLPRKRTLAARLRESFGREHGADDDFWRSLGQKLRKERAAVEGLLDPELDDDGPLAPGFELLRERSARLAPLAAELAALASAGALAIPVDEVAASLVHMHANRLLRSAHRAQECVLYYDLDRLYESQAARLRTRPDEARTEGRA